MTEQLQNPLSVDTLDAHQAELVQQLPKIVVDKSERMVVEHILIPQFREALNQVLANFETSRKLTDCPLTPSEIDQLCGSVDAMIISNAELLDTNGLFKPVLHRIGAVRQEIRGRLLEGFYEYSRNAFAQFGITDRESLFAKGVKDFKKLEFPPFGQGQAFAGTLLNRSMRGMKFKDLIALADALGYPALSRLEMNDAYFTQANVKNDLSAFAQRAGVTVEDLSTYRVVHNTAMCANGEQVKGPTYLSRAGVALGFGRTAQDIAGKFSLVLARLKEIAGVEKAPDYPPMDEAYFAQADNVKNDFAAFAKQCKKPVANLSKTDFLVTTATCSNGEAVHGATYLNRAGVALGFASTIMQAQKYQKASFDRLMVICGEVKKKYPKMDRVYFADDTAVKKDVEAFARAAGAEVGSLTIRSFLNNRITASSGEVVQGQTYLKRAAVGLGIVKSTREAGSKYQEVIDALIRKAGSEVVKFREMDSAYFDSATVRQDLNAYMTASAIPLSALLFRHMDANEVICANGESVKGKTYLRRAGVALKIIPAGTTTFNGAAVLCKLKEIALMDISFVGDLDVFEADLRTNLGTIYPDDSQRGMVELILIPELRTQFETALRSFQAQRLNMILPRLDKEEMDSLCAAIDAMLETNKALLNPEGLLQPLLDLLEQIRLRVRDEMSRTHVDIQKDPPV